MANKIELVGEYDTRNAHDYAQATLVLGLQGAVYIRSSTPTDTFWVSLGSGSTMDSVKGRIIEKDESFRVVSEGRGKLR